MKRHYSCIYRENSFAVVDVYASNAEEARLEADRIVNCQEIDYSDLELEDNGMDVPDSFNCNIIIDKFGDEIKKSGHSFEYKGVRCYLDGIPDNDPEFLKLLGDILEAEIFNFSVRQSFGEIVVVFDGKETAALPEKFENYSEFTQFFDAHDNDFETECDYMNEDGFGFCVHRHIPTGRMFVEDVDENNAEMFEVEKVAKLTYSVNHDLQTDTTGFSNMFDCDVCGETVHDDHIEFAWYKKVKGEKK